MRFILVLGLLLLLHGCSTQLEKNDEGWDRPTIGEGACRVRGKIWKGEPKLKCEWAF